MKRFSNLTFPMIFLLVLISRNLSGINTKDTRMLAQPAISASLKLVISKI